MAPVEKAVRDIYGSPNGLAWIRGGIYGLVDKDNVLFSSYGGTDIYAIGLGDSKPEAGLRILRSLKVKDILGDNEALFGLILTYDGYLVLLGERTVAVIDRNFKMKPQLVRLDADEAIRNSAAINEKGGIYVAWPNADVILNKKVRFQVFAATQHQSWLDQRPFESKNLEYCRVAPAPSSYASGPA